MKIYMAADMEGVSGIINSLQTGVSDGRHVEYERGRLLLTEDVNAAVTGALEGGAKKITVLDHHSGGFNFIAEKLHPGAEYITGSPRPSWLPFLDETFDAVFLIGYHAMAGTKPAVLEHTQSSASWKNYYINGIRFGEIGQAAAMAGHFNVPVVFLSGDRASCEEARELLGDIETAAVKEAITRTCAKILPPERGRCLIREKAAEAVKKAREIKPLKLEFPAEIKIEFQRTDGFELYLGRGWKPAGERAAVKKAATALDIL